MEAVKEEKGNYQYSGNCGKCDVTCVILVSLSYFSQICGIFPKSSFGSTPCENMSYVLKEKYGITLPTAMRESVGYMIKGVSDKEHKELSPEDIYQIFEDKYIYNTPIFQIVECHFKQTDGIDPLCNGILMRT